MTKLKISITLDEDLIEWIKSKIKDKTFSSASHAANYALFILKNTQND
jgi:Arc/MetJ-type ribon-helix-helix transcriptional regulator